MEETLFLLPNPLPTGAILLGPAEWSGGDLPASRGCRRFADPAEVLGWLAGEDAGSEKIGTAAVSRLVFIHQDVFAGNEGADQLVRWLEDLAALRQPNLPILLHGNLTGKQLVRFFRAGLFDALGVPIGGQQWLNMLIRAEKRLELRQQSRLLLADTEQTQDLLRSLRRKLGDETARSTGELLKAHESLEAANRQLSEAMAELSLLYRFGRELSTARNWDRVLREILKNLTDFVGAGGAALILRSAPGGSYSPRQTWQWEESAWDKVLVNLHGQVDDAVAESITAPGVFSVDSLHGAEPGGGRRIIALPLEHQDVRLGYLLILFASPEIREKVLQRYLPFLQAVQVVISEEVASAQMLDRIRDIGTFNARVLETVSSAIWVFDEAGQTVYCNRAGQELLTGQESQIMTSEEFLFQIGRGRHESEELTLADLPELFLDARLRLDGIQGLLLPAVRDAADGCFRGEGRVLRDDGQGTPVLVQTSLMPGRSREQTWLVVVAEDLRESRKLEAERLRSDRLEGLVEMSATLAHEIRNPLMGLSAQAELLADQLPPDDKRSRYIDVITAEVDRINETITRMLNFVRPYEPTLTTTPLLELARDSLDLVRPRADAKSIDLTMSAETSSTEPDDWLLEADAAQLKQVLLNLLINAIDAAPDTGSVELCLQACQQLEMMDTSRGTQRDCPGIILSVSDDGPGIKDGDLSRIFRPFFTTKSSGTGLGLSICHKIVAAHQGEIRAERRDVRTVFTVTLPRPETSASAQNQKQEEAR